MGVSDEEVSSMRQASSYDSYTGWPIFTCDDTGVPLDDEPQYSDRDQLIAVGYPECDGLELFIRATGEQR
jgi:hypothetical protein